MPSDGRTDYQHGKAYGRHVVLETIRHKAEVPHWVDAIIVRIIGLVHCVLFVGGLAVCGLGIVLSAGMAPSWTAASVSGMGGLVMLSTGTAIYALGVKRPDLLSLAMWGLVGTIGWVSSIAVVLYILVAQVDSPVAEYVVCNWAAEKVVVADLGICTAGEMNRTPPLINCSDPSVDVGVYDETPCQEHLIDRVHVDLADVNSKAYWVFFLLGIVILVNRNVAKQFVENDDPPDPITKVVVALILLCCGIMTLLMIVYAWLQWNYTYTSMMFVIVGSGTIPVVGLTFWVVWTMSPEHVGNDRKKLFDLTNALLIALESCLFIASVFGGFFTGDLQSISEIYHENWDVIGADIERAFPGICDGLDQTECKLKLKDLTLDQLGAAVNGLATLGVVVAVIVLLTWRAVINLHERIDGLHGLSQFDVDVIEKVVYLRREEIIAAADLYWDLLHHPHRPINTVLLRDKPKGAKEGGDINVGQLESTLREAERVRLKGMSPRMLEDECMKHGLHPTGSVQTLRRRLLKNYSSKRMAASSKGDAEHAKQHFFELGEPEMRLIPALAFCPFLDRLLDVFSEDGSGFLHFEEFLNMYSVFSPSCPLETKIRYAWCIYDLNATGCVSRAVLACQRTDPQRCTQGCFQRGGAGSCYAASWPVRLRFGQRAASDANRWVGRGRC